MRSVFVIVKKSFFLHERKIRFFFTFFVILYISLRKSKIYHKMQREKLYNLHNKTYFNYLFFVFEKRAELCAISCSNGTNELSTVLLPFENRNYKTKIR